VLLVGSDAPDNRDDGDSRELAAFVAETLGSTVDTHLIHRYGQPTEAILRTSTAAGADLIVMGSHGRTGVQRLLFGSVTEAVVRRSATPVLVAPRASAGLQHPVTLDVVLCAVDFSPARSARWRMQHPSRTEPVPSGACSRSPVVGRVRPASLNSRSPFSDVRG